MPRQRCKSSNTPAEVDPLNTTDPEILAEFEYAQDHPVKGSGDTGVPAVPSRDRMTRTKSEGNSANGSSESSPPNGVVRQKQVNSGHHAHRGKVLPRGPDEPRKQKNIPGLEEESYLDENDPNYDDDTQVNVTYEELDPELGVDELEKHAQPVIKEYFHTGDVREAIESIKEFNMSVDSRAALVRFGITLSMDWKKFSRELMSNLLTELVQRRVLGLVNTEKAFADILRFDLPDLVIDYPNAEEMVGNFLARAVADLAVSEKFLDGLLQEKSQANPQAKAALSRAEALMTQRNRLHDVWGLGGGQRPVRFLTRQMQLILQEYLTSQDEREAERCLRDLEVPHFNHEIVYQAGVMSIEMMHDRISERLAILLKGLAKSGVLTVDAISTGFDRLFAELPDLCLDVPPAYTLAERWVTVCQSTGLVSEDIKQKVPQKGRKRYVSEGDGGRLKVLDVAHPLI